MSTPNRDSVPCDDISHDGAIALPIKIYTRYLGREAFCLILIGKCCGHGSDMPSHWIVAL
jgi:hypothetical protein